MPEREGSGDGEGRLISVETFASILALASEKGWVDDRSSSRADADALREAIAGVRRANAHLRQVAAVMEWRWLGRIARCFRRSLRAGILAGEVRVQKNLDPR